MSDPRELTVANSTAQVYASSSEACAVSVAAVLHGLDPTTPSNELQEVERRAGCEGGRAGVCEADHGREGGTPNFLHKLLSFHFVLIIFSHSPTRNAPCKPRKPESAIWLRTCAP